MDNILKLNFSDPDAGLANPVDLLEVNSIEMLSANMETDTQENCHCTVT